MTFFTRTNVAIIVVLILVVTGFIVFFSYSQNPAPAKQIPTATPIPTKILNTDGSSSGYTKDSSHVYFNGDLIQGADPITFTASRFVEEGGDDEYGKDNNNVYFFGFLMPNVDTSTFQVFDSLQQCGTNRACTAQDKNHKYYQDQVIQ